MRACACRHSGEPAAGGTVTVSDWTRGGFSGVSRISTCVSPRSPRSHQRQCAGESNSGGRGATRPWPPGPCWPGTAAPSRSHIRAIFSRRRGSGSSSATLSGEELLRHLVVPVAQQLADHLLGPQRLGPGAARRGRRPRHHRPGFLPGRPARGGRVTPDGGRGRCARAGGILPGGGPQHLLHEPGGQHGCACVGAVGQHDHAEAGLRVPAHVTAEARVPAAVVDQPPPRAGLLGEQPEPVPVLAPRAAVAGEPRLRLGQGHGGLLHLAARGRGQRVGIAAPRAARREGRGKAIHPARPDPGRC